MFLHNILILSLYAISSCIDFSRAGKECNLNIPVAKVNIRDFGAIPDDGIDDSDAINKAINQLATTGGTVLVPEGVWEIHKIVKIDVDNLHLRGDKEDRTVFHCPKTLADVYGENKNWSWSGGFINLAPKGAPKTLASIIASSNDAASVVKVDWMADKPSVGDWVQIWWHNDTGVDSLYRWLYGPEVPSSQYGDELRAATGPRVRSWFKVTSTTESSMSFDPPLPMPARVEWDLKVMKVPYLQGSAVSNINFEFDSYPYPGHLKERGNNAISCNALIQGEIDQININNADSGIFVSNSGFTTLSDIFIKGRYMHHPISVVSSSHCLVKNFEILAPHRHGTTISWSSHFNVFEDGMGVDLAMDSHRACSFRNLHKNIRIKCSKEPKQPLRSGGAYDRGLHSARENAYVNIEFQFQGDGPPFNIKYLNEWPMGYFSGWHGNREIVMKPEFSQQKIEHLNEKLSP